MLNLQGDVCCWHCQKCQDWEYMVNEFKCSDCGYGRWPDNNATTCHDLPQKVCVCKDKLEDIDVSLTSLAIFFKEPLWPNSCADFKSWSSRWKILKLWSHWYLIVIFCRLRGLVTALCQSRVGFEVLPWMEFFHTSAENKNLNICFLKKPHLKTLRYKCIKPASNGHKYHHTLVPLTRAIFCLQQNVQ